MRRRQDGVHAGGLHVHPDGAGRDAVQDEQASVRVDRGGDLDEVVVGEDDARGRLHVRREDNRGFLALDRLHHLVDVVRRELGGGGVVRRLPAHDDGLGRDAGLLEDVGPPVGEVPVAQDEDFFAGGPLPGDCFHAVGARAGHDDGGCGVVRLLQRGVDVVHDLME